MLIQLPALSAAIGQGQLIMRGRESQEGGAAAERSPLAGRIELLLRRFLSWPSGTKSLDCKKKKKNSAESLLALSLSLSISLSLHLCSLSPTLCCPLSIFCPVPSLNQSRADRSGFWMVASVTAQMRVQNADCVQPSPAQRDHMFYRWLAFPSPASAYSWLRVNTWTGFKVQVPNLLRQDDFSVSARSEALQSHYVSKSPQITHRTRCLDELF